MKIILIIKIGGCGEFDWDEMQKASSKKDVYIFLEKPENKPYTEYKIYPYSKADAKAIKEKLKAEKR